MKNNLNIFTAIIMILLLTACSSNQFSTVTVTNPSNLSLKDVLIETEVDSKLQNIALKYETDEIPYQIVNENGINKLKFVVNLNSKETKKIIVQELSTGKVNNFKARTYAELSMKEGIVYYDKRFRGDKFVKVSYLKVPSIHTDHDALFKYEGPGWESELVGYRFYLDWRNATDIFGKKKNQLILDQVGTHDTVAKDDSYHSMQDWGMDIFKVGNSLGIGSIGMWADNKVNMVSKTDSVISSIPYTGPVEAKVNTKYYGWKVGDEKFDLFSDFSIAAGSRLTKCELTISKNADNIVTGLAKYNDTELIISNNKEGWNYLALYGNQTLVSDNDKLGIVIFYPANNLIEITEDQLSHIVKLKPDHGKVIYYFAAAWEQEEDGIKNIEQFKKYLEETIQQLNTPVIVEVN